MWHLWLTIAIGSAIMHPPGKAFLICNLDMKLVSVSKLSFIAEDLKFCARVNNSDYPMDTIVQSLLKTNKAGYSQSIDLKNDGEISRTVVFSIPEGTRNYKLICKGALELAAKNKIWINKVWVKKIEDGCISPKSQRVVTSTG